MPEAEQDLRLVLCVIRGHRRMDMFLTGLVELGVAEAWVSEVQGMGDILSADVPIFAGLGALFPALGGDAHLVTTVVPAGLLQSVESLVEDVAGPFSSAEGPVLLAVPLARYRGPAILLGG